MLRNLYINPNTGDLEITSLYNLKFTSTHTEWLAQKLEQRLKTFLGEWFANQSIGLPYYQRILKKQVNLNDVNNLFKNYIQTTRGVDEIIEFNTSYSGTDRTYEIDFIVKTSSGEIVEGSVTV